jgi:hypothetical protein
MKEKFFCLPIQVPYLPLSAWDKYDYKLGCFFSVPRANLRGRTRDRGDPGVAKLHRQYQHPARLSPIQTNGPVFWLPQVCDLILTACFSLVNNFRDKLRVIDGKDSQWVSRKWKEKIEEKKSVYCFESSHIYEDLGLMSTTVRTSLQFCGFGFICLFWTWIRPCFLQVRVGMFK